MFLAQVCQRAGQAAEAAAARKRAEEILPGSTQRTKVTPEGLKQLFSRPKQ